MTRRRKVSDAEHELLHIAMKDVKPLKRKTPAHPAKPVPAKAAAAKPAAQRAPVAARLAPAPKPVKPKLRAPAPVAPIDPRTERKLRRGGIAIDATLDLHGLKQHAAHTRLAQFIQRASSDGHKAVLVITGKGVRSGEVQGFMPSERRGVLKVQVPLWLEEPPMRELVRGVRSAGPRHGGAGALYVLLRKPKPR